MADNELTGTGKAVATDKVTHSGEADQNVQLIRSVGVTGTEGSKTVVDIPADSTYGLGADVKRLVPGTGATALGKAEDAGHSDGDTGVMALAVREYAGPGADGDYGPLSITGDGRLKVVPTGLFRIAVDSGGLTTATTAYTAGDQVGTQFTFANAARVSGGFGWIRSVTVLDKTDIVGAMDLVLTRASITLAGDNAAWAISDTDLLEVVAVVSVMGAYDLGNNRICVAHNLAIPYDCSGGTSLYGSLISRVGHTWFAAVTDLRVILHVERE